MEQLKFWSEIAQGVGSIASALITFVIGIYVYVYTKQKDKLDFINRFWAEQQMINVAELNSDENLVSHERMVCGPEFKEDPQKTRLKFQIFLYLNRILHFYHAKTLGVLTDKEFVDIASPMAGMVVRNRELVIQLLERGYAGKFKEEIVKLLETAKAPVTPQT